MSWLSDFFTYNGRLRRSQFLWRHFVLSFAGAFGGIALMFGIAALGVDQGQALSIALAVVMVPLMYAEISIVVRRFHDVGLSGWWVLAFFGPAFLMMGVLWYLPAPPWLPLLMFPLNIGFFVILLVIPGTRGDNKYGPPNAKLD